MATQPKKPVGGAHGRFLTEKREEIKASLPAGHKITDITKKAAELFKALSEEDKKRYQEQFEKANGEYKEAVESFKAGGGVIERKAKRGGKEEKKPKDVNAPKRPTGGAYGQFLAEKRAEITASLPADHKITDVAKKAGELYKALSEAETKRYQELFKVAQGKYEQAMSEYKANGGGAAAAASGSEGASPAKASPAKAAAKAAGKAKAKASPKASPKAAAGKRARANQEEPKGVVLDEALLKKARTLGYETQLKNLAGREDVAQSGKSPAQLLDALKASSGLVNAAKRALVGA